MIKIPPGIDFINCYECAADLVALVIIVLEMLLSKIIDVGVCRNMGGGADIPPMFY